MVITGSGFTGATGVTVGGVTAPTFVVDSDTQITITTPVHAPGATDVVVVSPNGNSAAASATFTFTAVPANGAGSGTGAGNGTDAAASDSPGTNLANTGVNAGVGVLALLATLLGGALLLITRRRRGLFGM